MVPFSGALQLTTTDAPVARQNTNDMDIVYIFAMFSLACFIFGFMFSALGAFLITTTSHAIMKALPKAEAGCVPECPTSKKDATDDVDHTVD